MPTNTSGGTTTSLNNTPQAKDDYFYADEDELRIFDVMANDLGGNAKVLWSIDETSDDGSGDLVAKDVAGVIEYSELGAKITLTADGKISYDSSTSSIIDSLAEGEKAYDQFTYAIRLSNGTLSWATVTVEITGTNDGPDIFVGAGDDAGEMLAETNAGLSTSGTLSVVDPDTSDVVDTAASLVVSGNQGALSDAALLAMFSITAGADDLAADSGDANNLSWLFDSGSEAFDYLADGESLTLTYTLTSTDGNGGSDTQDVVITINGTNDAAVITGDADGEVTEDAVPNTVSGTLVVSDPDNGESELQPIAAGTAGDNGYGTFEVNADGTWTYTLDNTNAAVQALNAGAFLMDTITVTSEDGTDTQVITVTIWGANDGVTLPPTYNGTGDPNDFDTLLAGSAAAGVVNTSGSNGPDTIHGSNVADNISGGTGNDTVYGHDGNDVINGQNGADVSLYGQAGDDTITGGSGADQIFGGSGADTIYGNEPPPGTVGGDAGDTIYGGSGNDTIYGQAGGDTIIGGYGADLLTGNAGDDIFRYLSKLDTNDTITDFRADGNDQLDLNGIDANELLGGDQDFVWGGDDGPIANGLWFTYDGGTNTTVLYGDTDGNLVTAEFMLTLQNFSGFNAYADPLTPPPAAMLDG